MAAEDDQSTWPLPPIYLGDLDGILGFWPSMVLPWLLMVIWEADQQMEDKFLYFFFSNFTFQTNKFFLK